MATTYSWEVSSLTHKTVGDSPETVVSFVAFRNATDEDSGAFAQRQENITFDESNIDLTNLLEFSDLTEEDVLGWISSVLSEERIAEIDTYLQERLPAAIEYLNNPKSVAPPPWAIV